MRTGRLFGMRVLGWLALGLILAFITFAVANAQGEDERFMPKGGRTLLLESLGAQPGVDEFRRIASSRNTDAQWEAFVAGRAVPAGAREKATLAAYLSVNMPLPEKALASLQPGKLADVLPRDGRELAWQQCQFCHSLYSSHLTQRRDVQGWRNMFLSPFHRELKMTPQEREEFARYSAINMPMNTDDVPKDLRF
ncbi:hypothetical protein [Piscinibacter gummiphilus]|uniref:Cytochrome c domain-containing protein n=1 Tax=Piscinibacter gummiphilus TaxID=946333 RepID=A0ABZ0D1I5_9BURK|nr:hypothetical protein [Piscinibacter gummiphilus]WOB10611.1 hypothetical protein RXV79_11260 [Piscinibacter gummiphilus]